jgi:hypothetical protein
MRGGSIPVLLWALILLVLFAGNWIYQGDPTQTAVSAGALGVIVLWGLGGLLFAGREALRRGAPAFRGVAEGQPAISVGAACAGFALATIVFGLVWGHFLIYFGAGLLVLALGRLAIELRSERESVRAHRPPGPQDTEVRPQPGTEPSQEREAP